MKIESKFTNLKKYDKRVKELFQEHINIIEQDKLMTDLGTAIKKCYNMFITTRSYKAGKGIDISTSKYV